MIPKRPLQRYIKLLLILMLLAGTDSRAAAAEWYDDYDEGVKAAESQNWATAEAKLKSALAHQTKQGKKVRVYGTRFMKYIPSYYLGVVYMNTGRYEQALDQFSIVQNNGLVGGSDPEFARMTAMIQTAKSQGGSPPPPKPSGPTPEQLEAKRNQQEAADLIEKSKGLVAQGKFDEARRTLQSAKSKDPANPSLNDLSKAIDDAQARQAKLAEEQKLAEQKQTEQQKHRDFENLITKSNQQLSSKNYTQARSLASQAAAIGLDNQRTTALLNSIDAAEKQEKDLLAKQTTKQEYDRFIASAKQAMSEENWPKARSFINAAKATGIDTIQTTALTKEIDRLEKQSFADSQQPKPLPKPEIKSPASSQTKQEEDALLAFYSGKYAESVALLQQLIARKPSARLYFYLGCNNAALAFLAGKQAGDPYKQKARDSFAQAHKIDPGLRPDQKFISPRILQFYNQSF